MSADADACVAHRSHRLLADLRAAQKLSQPSRNAWYAVKMRDKELVWRQQNGTRNVFNELNSLSGLTHPFLQNLRYAFYGPEHCFMVMDLALGGTLHDAMKMTGKPAFSEKHAHFYGAQLASALAYTHEQGVVHRDVTPEAIMMLSNG